MDKVLDIKKLEVGFNTGKLLVKEFDISANSGECISIMGRNGEGKTTLLKTLSGLMKPLSGDIVINGKNLQNMNVREKAAVVSIVLTEKPMVSNITVEELIGFGRYPYTGWLGMKNTSDVQLINESIELCELEDFRHRKIFELSDGERQKVMIARCLAQNTNLILLDEPTIHLDVSSKITVFQLLKNIAKEKNVCVIFITHELNLAIDNCNKIWLLNQGEVSSMVPRDAVKGGSINKAFGINFSA